MEEQENKYTKWVACWGNATSISDRKMSVYARDITLRYPIRMCFSGSKLRFRFSNLTGTEEVTLTKVRVAKVVEHYRPVAVTFDGARRVHIAPGREVESDEIALAINAGDVIEVSIYLGSYTQMNAGTLVTGPLSKGKFSYGDYTDAKVLPLDLTRNTNWFYFLNTIDILTEEKNHALVCYGDSITAQSWPDYLANRAWNNGWHDVSIIRRAVSGTRILRQYNCITYQAYGLKGETRFPIEMNVAGARDVIIQHGINDIIHPVGVDVNPFRVERYAASHLELENLCRVPRQDTNGVQRMAAHCTRLRRLHRFREGREGSGATRGFCSRLRFGRPSAPKREGLRGNGGVRAGGTFIIKIINKNYEQID